MKKNKELVYLEQQLRQLKSSAKKDSYTSREIEDIKKEIREIKNSKDGK
jgi:hypothetical protein